MRHSMLRILAGICILFLSALPVFAALTGDISGTVTDPNGAVISGAKVDRKSVV